VKKTVLQLGIALGIVAIATYVLADGPQPSVGLYWFSSADPTIAPGMSAPLNQLLVRTDSPSLYYKSGATNTSWTKIGAGGPAGVTSITCGTGLTCTPNPITGTGTIATSPGTNSSVYYADGGDGTCNFDGVATPVCGATLSGSTYTLQRDIAPLNMTVAAGVIVREDNWRVMVYGTLTGGGAGATITNGGFPGSGALGGHCGGLNTHYYQACNGAGGAGAMSPGAGNGGSSNPGAIPQWPAQSASPAGSPGAGLGQGGGGGTTGAGTGGTGGSIANPSVNVGYFDAIGGWSGRYDSYGNQWDLYGTGGGGGGCAGGACTGGGGGGGGGIAFVSANQCAGTLLIASGGGAGADGVLAGGTGASGGGGGGGGVVIFIYSHRAAGCTTTVPGGAAGNSFGTGGAAGAGSSGTAQLYNLSGDGS